MKISVIIPALNEESKIFGVLDFLTSQDGDIREIILSDGGSSDKTKEIARSFGVKVVDSAPGRAKQMNAGARVAEGEIVYFLHVDTIPPESFTEDILRVVEDGAGAGCFRLRFDNDHKLLNVYSWFTRFDIDLFRFGDQSLFVRREFFDRIGGFREDLKVMEDQVIIKDLKKITKFRIVNENVITSARKYEQVGMLRLQVIFAIIVFMFYSGVPQDKIVAFYRGQLNRAMLR